MSSTTATTNPAPPEFVISFPSDFRDLPLEREPAIWEATASAFLDLVPVARPPEHRELALAHLRAYSALLTTGGVVKAAACLGSSDGALSSPTPADWESYQVIMAVICRSIRFRPTADPLT
ncbi:MAG: hypothetical protein ACRDQX_07550 [Pseudonocardiaceae bacterium]